MIKLRRKKRWQLELLPAAQIWRQPVVSAMFCRPVEENAPALKKMRQHGLVGQLLLDRLSIQPCNMGVLWMKSVIPSGGFFILGQAGQARICFSEIAAAGRCCMWPVLGSCSNSHGLGALLLSLD